MLARQLLIPTEAGTIIDEVERGRLAELEWMLAEALRKSPWPAASAGASGLN
jgi:hypothetical protein